MGSVQGKGEEHLRNHHLGKVRLDLVSRDDLEPVGAGSRSLLQWVDTETRESVRKLHMIPNERVLAPFRTRR